MKVHKAVLQHYSSMRHPHRTTYTIHDSVLCHFGYWGHNTEDMQILDTSTTTGIQYNEPIVSNI